jgi:serine/threonine protein phosphatase 1
MLKGLFSRKKAAAKIPCAPENSRVYAVGDIHGRLDLLHDLQRQIADDAADAEGKRCVVVYLGDYIDRGDQSSAVINCLIDEPIAGCEQICLMGNHEEMLLTFLEDPSIGSMWMFNGGDATLLSYGCGTQGEATAEGRLMGIQRSLREKLPEHHLAFLRALRLYHIEGGYAFVHAGIAPKRPIEKQVSRDLLWIRSEFLQSKLDHGHCIVHGHTIYDEPDFQSNRIGIDTGAFRTGVLTCLVLDGEEQRLLKT